jgi:hypothetical protein
MCDSVVKLCQSLNSRPLNIFTHFVFRHVLICLLCKRCSAMCRKIKFWSSHITCKPGYNLLLCDLHKAPLVHTFRTHSGFFSCAIKIRSHANDTCKKNAHVQGPPCRLLHVELQPSGRMTRKSHIKSHILYERPATNNARKHVTYAAIEWGVPEERMRWACVSHMR